MPEQKFSVRDPRWTPPKYECPKCGEKTATHRTHHEDTDMEYRVLRCPCGFRKEASVEETDHADAWHPKYKRFQRIDVQKLIALVEGRMPQRVPISEIWGGEMTSPGFSEQRVRDTDTKHPILVDSYFEGVGKKYGLVDGRHRKIKMLRAGKTEADIIPITEADIEGSTIEEDPYGENQPININKAASTDPLYDWDGTLIPNHSGNAAEYFAYLDSLTPEDVSEIATGLAGKKVDLATARPALFHAKIRETAERLGISLGDIHHAGHDKTETVRTLKRPLIDNNEEVVRKIHTNLGQEHATLVRTHEIKRADFEANYGKTESGRETARTRTPISNVWDVVIPEYGPAWLAHGISKLPTGEDVTAYHLLGRTPGQKAVALDPELLLSSVALTSHPEFKHPTSEITLLRTPEQHRRKGYASSLLHLLHALESDRTLMVTPDPLSDKTAERAQIEALYRKAGYDYIDGDTKHPMVRFPLMNKPASIESDFRSVKLAAAPAPLTGPAAIAAALERLDIGKLKEEQQAILKQRKVSKRPRAVQVLNIIEGLERNNAHPRQFLTRNVPVIPPVFRPFSLVGTTFIPGDANELYRDLMDLRQAYDDESKTFGPEGAGNARLNLYDAIKAVYGYGEPVKPKTKQRGVSGFLQKITGSNPKFSFVQRKLLGKPQDNVSRGTIAVDPELSLDEIGMPIEQAWTSYKEYVQKRLIQSGMSPAEALRHIRDRSDYARRALETEVTKRPVIYSRAPSWHKFNVVAGRPKLIEGNTITINPLVTTGLNADFDGDAIHLHVPATDGAVGEAWEKLMPSKMLFSIRDPEKVVPQPKHELILGLYTANRRQAKQQFRFPDEKSALDAIKLGKVSLSDDIQIGELPPPPEPAGTVPAK